MAHEILVLIRKDYFTMKKTTENFGCRKDIPQLRDTGRTPMPVEGADGPSKQECDAQDSSNRILNGETIQCSF